MSSIDSTTCSICQKRKSSKLVDTATSNCFDCLGVCSKCKLSPCSCSKQVKYRSSIVNNPLYRGKGKETVTQRIISALLQMHSQGKDCTSVRGCLLDRESDAVCQAMESIQSKDSILTSRINVNTFTTLQMCLPKISLLAESVISGHPSIVETSAVVCSCCMIGGDLHSDFPMMEGWSMPGDKFLRSPLGLIIALESESVVVVRGVYKTGTFKDVKRLRLLKGDGIMYRGDLLHTVEGCRWFLCLTFGT